MVAYNNERRPLPTKEQIDALTDVGAIEDMLLDVERTVEKIEVDLEFRTEGDDDWEARARAALTAHRICRGHLRHRLRQLTGKAERNRLADETAKLEKAQRHSNQVDLAKAANDRRRLDNERLALVTAERNTLQHEKTQRAAISLIERTSFLSAFLSSAKAMLPDATYCALVDAAQERHAANVAAAVQSDPILEGVG